ncbi:MAG: hypothetical protein GY811_10405 [Myxococcales bacterium]|nr:hypothetical protein [Myxococcales bacterium]
MRVASDTLVGSFDTLARAGLVRLGVLTIVGRVDLRAVVSDEGLEAGCFLMRKGQALEDEGNRSVGLLASVRKCIKSIFESPRHRHRAIGPAFGRPKLATTITRLTDDDVLASDIFPTKPQNFPGAKASLGGKENRDTVSLKD